jgi:rSAM/selenodomain-associated transferase 1
MNTGAAALDTPWLLFLHADSRIPERSLKALESWLEDRDARDFATFLFSIEGDHWFWRFIEIGQGIRERTSGLVYGDQGLLLSRALFQEVGGFPELPLMEDLEILKTLRKRGRWRKIPEPVLTSPRRYQGEGRWRGWLRNTALITLHLAGVPPERLVAFYPARPLASPERTLLVFAKEPRAGRVKTRLAAEIGAGEAARIYREMGRRIVDQLRDGPYRTIVFFDPPGAGPEVMEWLGPEGLEFLPQAPGDLGSRLEAAFREGFRRGKLVAVVGTDAPDVDSEVVKNAFRKLSETDLVLGPATDGGYYLLGLKSEAGELFQDIPWSTPAVLTTTVERAEAMGLSIATLPALSDVDTAEDLKALNDRKVDTRRRSESV